MRSLSEAPGRGPAGDYALWDGDGTCILHDADHVSTEQDLDIAQRKEKWFADQESHHDLCLRERVKDSAIQKFIAKPRVERLDEAVLRRTAWRDVGCLRADGPAGFPLRVRIEA